MGGANEENRSEHRARARGSEETKNFHGALAANVHSAEVENDMAAGGGPAKTQHRAETREKKNLVELMAQRRTRGAGKNFIVHHLATSVDSDINLKALRKR